jgi:hypothetical protein
MIAAVMAFLVASGAPTPHVSWKDGEGCAYFPVKISTYAFEGFTVADFREILDDRGRTIGVLYVSDDGRYAIEGNPFMSDAEVERHRLTRDAVQPYWTGVAAVDLRTIHHPVVECRRDHIMKAWPSVTLVLVDAGRAYRRGLSHIPDARVDLYP